MISARNEDERNVVQDSQFNGVHEQEAVRWKTMLN